MVQFERAVDVGRRSCGVGSGQQQPCAAEIAVVERGVVAQQFIEGFAGAGVVFDVGLCEGFVEEQLAVAGQQTQSVVVVLDGGSVEPEILPGHAAHFVGVGEERIQFDCLGRVGFGTAEIVEVDFRHRPQEVWLCHVWLGGDGLVEILDREHVVLEV